MGTAEAAGPAVPRGGEPSVRRGQAPTARRTARRGRPWPLPTRTRPRPRARNSLREQPSHPRVRRRTTEAVLSGGATGGATRALATTEAEGSARQRLRSTTTAEGAVWRSLRVRATARVRTMAIEAGRATMIGATGAGASRGKAKEKARARRRASEERPEPRASWAQCCRNGRGGASSVAPRWYHNFEMGTVSGGDAKGDHSLPGRSWRWA